MKRQFIWASPAYATPQRPVPAPYLRRAFSLPFKPETAVVRVCGLGFYRLFVNGREITKGELAPYVSNPDDVCYYDDYDLTPYLTRGKNAIGVWLGNGMINAPGGYIWDFDKAVFRGAPRLCLEFEAKRGEKTVAFSADSRFRTAPSPVLFDDLRYGETYDARREIAGWSEPDFDDRKWKKAGIAEKPRGEFRLAAVEPVRALREIKPVAVFPAPDGYIYDFGVNTAGVCRLTLSGAVPGQKLTLRYVEQVKDGDIYLPGTVFNGEYTDYNQRDIYIAKGDAVETWQPHFCYHGFRYAKVWGITEEQATPDLLTYVVMGSDLTTIGGFTCSDETANTLFRMAQNADRSNFYYFPTDCPHREKNGWTGDAAFSCYHMSMYYDCEKSYREWLADIRKSQNDRGELPGIVPTSGWGFAWGNGPAWDQIAFVLPWVLWKYRGNTDVIRENAHTMVRYLQYAMTRRSPDGTIAIGLGDWSSVGRSHSRPETPLAVTDSVIVADIAHRAADMFRAVGYDNEAVFAESVWRDMRATVRRELMEKPGVLKGGTQTGQALGLLCGVFEESEIEAAKAALVDAVHRAGDSFSCGAIGFMSVLPALTLCGESELAWHMVTKREYPSFAHLIDLGETALSEHLMPDGAPDESHNHHFFADYIRWFMQDVAGLVVEDSKKVTIKPSFLSELTFAKAHHDLPQGRVSVEWRREGKNVTLTYTCPDGVDCRVDVPQNVIVKKEV